MVKDWVVVLMEMIQADIAHHYSKSIVLVNSKHFHRVMYREGKESYHGKRIWKASNTVIHNMRIQLDSCYMREMERVMVLTVEVDLYREKSLEPKHHSHNCKRSYDSKCYRIVVC